MGTGRRLGVNGFAVLAYLFMAGAGASALLAEPSPSLVQQGGYALTAVWSAVSIAGAVTGFLGVLSRSPVWVLLGSGLCASACLLWGASLVLQAVYAGTRTQYTAACAAGALVALFVQHCLDVASARRVREE